MSEKKILLPDNEVVDSYPRDTGLLINYELLEWQCNLFGSDGLHGMVYKPLKDNVPNRFIRWMMKICLGCTWVKTVERE